MLPSLSPSLSCPREATRLGAVGAVGTGGTLAEVEIADVIEMSLRNGIPVVLMI